ncbi:hypothetical protein OEZ85_005805 [Tetradesmus obliquus]|uniref:Uncharacterized protein n=1 Tax=Tetradesmus obliquus TaxID=3088 RepID=A0ABY8UEH8_TETOB|nr:hypothetical protein OEZ85_005805 [Tetradesmus obliquus]
MNIEQDRLESRIVNQIQDIGLSEFRRQALKGLKLKTVIKESHCSAVQALAFNLCDAGCRNLFATVGKDQATIYDDQHMSDHIAVVASLSLSDSIEQAQDAFQVCCWVNCSGLSRHPYGDALLAVAGSDPHIHIISVAEAAAVAQLPLPPGASAVELSAAAEQPGLLLVLCRDGTLQLWQVASGLCCCSIQTDAFAVVLHPQGHYAITSSRTGKPSSWDLQPVLHAAAQVAAAAAGAAGSDPSSGDVEEPAAAAAALAAAAAAVVKSPLQLEQCGLEGSAVDCMRFLTGDTLAAKTADGRMAVLQLPSGKRLSSWRIPGCSHSTASYSSRCCFGHTRDGQYICVGNHNAAAYVFDTLTGSQLARVEAIKVQGSVRAAGLSEDCRHLVMVAGSGYVFRFEHTPAAAAAAAEEQL